MSDKIERIIDALRKKILESAIRGELVPQNPEDEPASKLLERIAEERERLIKEKKIKKPKSSSCIFRRDGHFYESINGGKPTCIDDDIPFEIPDSWEWVRLEHIVQVVTGKTPSTQQCDNYEPSEICFYKPADINEKFCYIEQAKEQVSTKGASCAPLLPSNSILVSCIGNIGKCSIISKAGICNQQINAVLPSSHLNMQLLLYFLRSEEMKQQEIEHSSATTISILNKSTFVSLLIPLPPKDEQKRITGCINTYFTQLDAIGDSRQRYKRILFETPTSLRQQLIQSAIQGQLVPQNPSDEPASVLLERIAQERIAKLGKKAAKSMSRIIRRGSKTYEIFPDGSEKDISGEIPFDIPDSWEWSRLFSVLQIARGGSPRPIKDYLTSDENGVNWIKIGDATKGSKYIFTTREKIKPEGIAKSRLVNPGDFLLSNSMSFGRPYILKTSGCIHDGWLVLSGVELCFNVDFLFYLLSTPLAKSQFAESASGAVVQNLNIAKVENAIFPIPPMEEQVRIQAAISDLFADMPI